MADPLREDVATDTDAAEEAAEEGAAASQKTDWSVSDAEELYFMDAWSDGYFRVGDDGTPHVTASPGSDHSVSIRAVVDEVRRRGPSFPMVIRFQDVLHGRVVQLNRAFADAVEEFGYKNRYTGVYPIKVNQLHEVVEEVLDAGRPFGMGLECGSKAELIATLPHLEDEETLLICNGYKDNAMLDLILTGQVLGRNVIPVIEKYDEYEALRDMAERRGVRPQFGVRVRLVTAGSGKWAESGGDLSKFGISFPELVRLIEELHESDTTDSFRLLHFHLGSQISDIRALRRAVTEITQIYAELASRGVEIRYLDVGGGLGVNYGGSYTSGDDSINYTVSEYANAVVQSVMDVCTARDVPQPVIVSESGRALTAHHSMLAVSVVGTYRKDFLDPDFDCPDDASRVVQDLWSTWSWVRDEPSLSSAQLLEVLHDASGKRQEADSLFGFGLLPLEQKALAEEIYWTICRRVNEEVHTIEDEPVPPELEALDAHLVDQCLCDFSVFQSALDHWAIGQRFPVMPLQRMDERPSRRAVIMDLTCDSDGKIATYVSPWEEKKFIEMHDVRPGETYCFGFFLMGAYQDIMGDTHNLFGRLPEAHVYLDEEEPEGFYIEKILPGTDVEGILANVQYFPMELQDRMNKLIRSRIDSGDLRPKAGFELLDAYRRTFGMSTYYSRDDNPQT